MYKNVVPILDNIIMSSSVSQNNAMEIVPKFLSLLEFMMTTVIKSMNSLTDLQAQKEIFIN